MHPKERKERLKAFDRALAKGDQDFDNEAVKVINDSIDAHLSAVKKYGRVLKNFDVLNQSV